MKRIIFWLGIISLFAVQAGFGQYTPQQYRVLKTIPVEGNGYWDYLIADPSGTRLFISHGTCVQVLDLKTEKLIATIQNTPGVHGIALVPEFGKGFISAGKIDSVIVFDLASLKVIAKIKTGSRPDAIIYDPVSKRVFSFDAGGNDVTAIDAKTNSVAGHIDFPGNPENAVPDGTGKMFVNIEDIGAIIKFDAKTLKIDAQWPLAPGKEPTGLAYDGKNKRLFSGCSGSRQLIVMDAVNGKVIKSLPIGEHCDGVVFVAEDQNIVTSNGDGTMTVIHQGGPSDYAVIQTLKTRKSARTITYDASSRRFFLSAADVNMSDGKRTVSPGSFCIISAGR